MLTAAFLAALAAVSSTTIVSAQSVPNLNVAWGFGGSAFQLEGAWDRDGKGLGTFDKFYQEQPGHVTGNVASGHYDRMVPDIAYLKQFGSTAYRFSVSWPRILPNCGGAVNPLGIAFYRRMIDEVIANGAEPYFTMFHWDLPQACQDQFGGFGDERIIEAFVEYAKVLFENFGDKITYWLTINEPEANCKFGWEQGIFAPGQRLGTQIGRFNCLKWSHIIHGRIVQYARQNYPDRGWKFGVPSIVSWYQAAGTQSAADLAAADFVQQRDLSWFFDPVVFGDWGEAAKTDPVEGQYVRNAAFTPAEQAIMRNTTDFIALNYYSTSGIRSNGAGGYEGAAPPISYRSGSAWQNVYAPGLRMLANYVHRRYNMDIHVTEIGYAGIDESRMTLDQIVNNPDRLRFWQEHLSEFRAAIVEDNLPIRSFLAWAIMDNFEWIQYESKFGAIHVDFASPNLTRTVKNSTYYLSEFFRNSRSPFPAREVTSSTLSSRVSSATATATATNSAATTAVTTGAAKAGSAESVLRLSSWMQAGVAVAVVVVMGRMRG